MVEFLELLHLNKLLSFLVSLGSFKLFLSFLLLLLLFTLQLLLVVACKGCEAAFLGYEPCVCSWSRPALLKRDGYVLVQFGLGLLAFAALA
jgi:hypothetical protein